VSYRGTKSCFVILCVGDWELGFEDGDVTSRSENNRVLLETGAGLRAVEERRSALHAAD
jgi:hypothetical protein